MIKLFIFFLLAYFPCYKLAIASERASLKPFLTINTPLLSEGSAFLKSPNLPDVFWAINDSHNTPSLFAFDSKARLICPLANNFCESYSGIEVRGAENKDWEAIAADNKGNLIICDIGNNKNKRKDLAIYIVPEPNPKLALSTELARKISFKYPDQKEFPPKRKGKNFDAEACFWHKGHLYLLTKHRGDSKTKLYRFNTLSSSGLHLPKLIGEAEIGSMVTDASISPNGKQLAVLTYDGAFIFELSKKHNLLAGKKKEFRFEAGQCEGITFCGNERLIISNEAGHLFMLKASNFE